LCVPEPSIVCTNSGPNERAGLVEEPVTGPTVTMWNAPIAAPDSCATV
jgi:hypothetical protein